MPYPLMQDSMLNRLFFIACLALSVWAFCFSIANSAQRLMRVPCFGEESLHSGWGTVYSLLLHFFLILTERKKILEHQWIYAIIYIPAFVNVYAFGFSGLARGQYNLIHSPMGWVNISGEYMGRLVFQPVLCFIHPCGFVLDLGLGKKIERHREKNSSHVYSHSLLPSR